MGLLNTARLWARVLAAAWRTRRTDAGGFTDETAMIGLMLLAAVAVGTIVMAAVTGAAGKLEGMFGF